MDFILIESEYPNVPRLILSRVPSLSNTPEYRQLGVGADELPGVVAAALTAYLGRLQEAAFAGQLDLEGERVLSAVYDLIEELASSNDGEVITLVKDEIFENFQASEQAWTAFSDRLGPQARRLLADWSRRNPR